MKLINIDIWQLLEMAETKKIVCFGAGKKLVTFINSFKKFHIQNKIYCVLDNDESKNQTVINVVGKLLEIYSFRYFQQYMKIKDCVILITSVYVDEIIEQLNNYEPFENTQCCYCDFIQALTDEKKEKERYYPKDFRIYNAPRIPKKIHYCWFGKGEIPCQNRIWMKTWKKYCSDYEIIEWNETNYDVTKNQYMHSAYKSQKWGFVSDYARLDVIYNYGGIYLDTDVELIRSLDELLYQDAFAGVDCSMRISTGLGFGAIPQFHIVKDLLNSYDDIQFNDKNMVACPALNEEVFRKYNFVRNGNYQRVGGMTIYPEKVLSGKNAFTGVVSPTDHTFAIHHYDATWVAEEKNIRKNRIQMLYKDISDKQ